MARRTLSIEFLGSDANAYVPHLAVDCAVFGFHGGALKLLLTHWKRRNRWSLPGGFVRRRESLDDAAGRVLRMRTGLENGYLEQFHTFGHPRRGDPRISRLFARIGRSAAPRWIRERVISVGYYALVDWSRATPAADGILTDDCRWWDLADHPRLLFDHDEMVERALRVLRSQLGHRPIGVSLFPNQFTLPELQQLHESILGRKLDRRNFQKKMRESGLLERVGQRRGKGIRRAPYLYEWADGEAV